ncbi:hypothetical protein MKY98_02900 [Paenibacillus sp. FSL M8-0228]|uniref:hypothetical protein n=1 Tax=Paenibacillus sp. FSL M8-0228 TaxID=2921620 RepID=UPI0030F65CA8
MRNWKYSEHDGKHIINDDRGVLVAMVVDAQTAELIVRQHKRLADERIITLPDGLEPMSGDDLQTIWNKADNARGDQAHLSDDVFDLVNALEAAYAQIDSLQHQLIQKDREMSHVSERLKFIDDGMDKTVAGFDRVVAQRDDLKKQLAERDRTIARLSADLDSSVSSQIDMTDKAYRFQKALEFYADKENYKLTRPFRDDEPTCGNVSEIEYDNGKLARQALGE